MDSRVDKLEYSVKFIGFSYWNKHIIFTEMLLEMIWVIHVKNVEYEIRNLITADVLKV